MLLPFWPVPTFVIPVLGIKVIGLTLAKVWAVVLVALIPDLSILPALTGEDHMPVDGGAVIPGIGLAPLIFTGVLVNAKLGLIL